MTSAPPDTEERRGLMSRGGADAYKNETTEDIDPATGGGRRALMSGRQDEVWFGGGQGSRTPDPYVANVVLSQLS